ncbi:hypothetical protein EJB05_11344, partial [Eragrostis curvula]
MITCCCCTAAPPPSTAPLCALHAHARAPPRAPTTIPPPKNAAPQPTPSSAFSVSVCLPPPRRVLAMAFRGRGRGGRGRGRGSAFDYRGNHKEYENFPEIKLPEMTCSKASKEEKELLRSTLKFEEFWKTSCYHLEEDVPKKKNEDKEIERFSDRRRKTHAKREALALYLKLTESNFPAELLQGTIKSKPTTNKKLRWDNDSDTKAFEVFEKLEQTHKARASSLYLSFKILILTIYQDSGTNLERIFSLSLLDGDKKEEKEGDDEDEQEEEEAEEEESSDDDYNQNIEFDDDDDDWNQEEETHEDYYD